MTDPIAALTPRVQEAMAAAFGADWAEADPVIRPANKRQTDADVQVNAAMAAGKRLGRPPHEVAQAIVDHLDHGDLVEHVEIAGPGFLNVTFSSAWIGRAATALREDDHFGVVRPPRQTVVVDYSSVNAAKEMHVAHLRSAVVGDSLVRTLEYLGHDVIRQNHLGDWGTPFGMLIEHLLEVGEDSDDARLLQSDPNAFYRAARGKFTTAENAEPAGSVGDFDVRSRRRVTLLQAGEEDTLRLWREILELSRVYLNRVYGELDITLTDDDIAGESSYNDELPGICDALQEKGLAVISEGALCVFLDGYRGRDDKPLPLIVRKSDGGYGYPATDLATIRHRSLDLHADRALYVVGAPQHLHFQMVWETARLAGWIKDTEPIHVQIGNVVGTDGKILRTRSGEVADLQHLVDAAFAKAAEVIADSRPELDAQTRDVISHQVGVAALKYADLSVAHDSGYTFDLDRMVALTGDTGPYLQYATARIRSILARAGVVEPVGPIVVRKLAERALALRLLDFGAVVVQVGETLEPHRVCTYLSELAQTFSTFYEQCPVVKAEDDEVRESRLALCHLTRAVLVDGLGLLGITAPDQM
ncbi:arginine--tRNA ligase [Allobranchiibius sp. GilTou38]|uniref:arginine--tRNA ligase n=1 Tax=Allobranchiibius sp. GilTou38 TaxID=2815210 RepID=UPI001AA0C400|nr:arginine--tRNA ligase [Allobranchiibius sp. GilTou38]MBO1765427.1 arginine--tRNA ligase [Allobranchiibius sp. GilTou38]